MLKKLFVKLLNALNFEGDITEATMYKSGTFATIKAKIEGDNYTFTITKEKEENKGDKDE